MSCLFFVMYNMKHLNLLLQCFLFMISDFFYRFHIFVLLKFYNILCCLIFFLVQGADVFDADVCLEVQWVDELAVAAIERRGSIVTSRYYDIRSLPAIANPEK